MTEPGRSSVVRSGPPAAVRAEEAALRALGPLELPGLVRPGAGGVGTERVDGIPLVDVAPMPWPDVQAVLAPVAEALAAIHGAGWVHGDVAPPNIVVADGDGRGVLVDLGCAAPAAFARATGTPGFVAPEVAAGRPVTPAAEVWSLAAVALASVERPTPAAAALALRRALADDPGDRPAAAALAAVLRLGAGEALVRSDPPDPRAATTREFGPRPPAPSAPPPAPARRARPLVAAAVVAFAGAGGWWLTRSAPAPARAGAAEADPCPPVPDGAPLVGDPDGDGCDVAASWSAGVLTIALSPGDGRSSIAVGAAGDVVVLGDWNCDGVDTPAAYRPSTGVLTTWDRWPAGGGEVPPTTTSAHAAGGTVVVDHDEVSGCDRLRVTIGL